MGASVDNNRQPVPVAWTQLLLGGGNSRRSGQGRITDTLTDKQPVHTRVGWVAISAIWGEARWKSTMKSYSALAPERCFVAMSSCQPFLSKVIPAFTWSSMRAYLSCPPHRRARADRGWGYKIEQGGKFERHFACTGIKKDRILNMDMKQLYVSYVLTSGHVRIKLLV